MKSVIYNFYNITIENLDKVGSDYYFILNEELYLFCLVENNLDKLKKIFKIMGDNIQNHFIILNINGELFSNFDSKTYSLLRVKGIYKYEIKPFEFKYYKTNEVPIDWGIVWGNRLDYYEIQLRELGINYQTLINSFGFFAGLSENAILYYNLAKKTFNDDEVVGIVHNRMQYPCYSIDYNNPLKFVIDYNVRDISEYIKSYIFSDDFCIDNVIELCDRLQLNTLMFNFLFARLLYSTIYFDMFDMIILGEKEDSDIIPILNRVDEYINTIKVIYNRFKNKYQMLNIEWINKT